LVFSLFPALGESQPI